MRSSTSWIKPPSGGGINPGGTSVDGWWHGLASSSRVFCEVPRQLLSNPCTSMVDAGRWGPLEEVASPLVSNGLSCDVLRLVDGADMATTKSGMSAFLGASEWVAGNLLQGPVHVDTAEQLLDDSHPPEASAWVTGSLSQGPVHVDTVELLLEDSHPPGACLLRFQSSSIENTSVDTLATFWATGVAGGAGATGGTGTAGAAGAASTAASIPGELRPCSSFSSSKAMLSNQPAE